MIRAIRAFLEFCYIARRNIHTTKTLGQLDDALERFHHYRTIFIESGVIKHEVISLPRQHSMMHYKFMIWEFAAPNGLCSSITESKHIKAVKEPWRRSNRYNALGQMLLTNQRLDKLAACRVHFAKKGMLDGPLTRPNIGIVPDSFLLSPTLIVHIENTATSIQLLETVQIQVRDQTRPDDDGAIDGPRCRSFMRMAQTIRMCCGFSLLCSVGSNQ